ncbi:unnamed protein product [Effrenium voratum]|nr:unnamed protein product [Effrenium voratum]
MLSSPILLPAPASSGGPCQAICLTMGVVVTPEMTERPQEALFAEANRMLHAVLGLTGEGEVPGPALSRSLAVFTAAAAWTNCRPQVLLSEWFDHTRLLDLFALFPMRTAYDCAPKRYRAHFGRRHWPLAAMPLVSKQGSAQTSVGQAGRAPCRAGGNMNHARGHSGWPLVCGITLGERRDAAF